MESNPTAQLVKLLPGADCPAPGVELTARTLPVSYEDCAAWSGDVLAHGTFDLVIHTGVAAGSSEFRLETTARNRCGPARPDSTGRPWPMEAIAPGEAAQLRTCLDVEQLASALAARDLPVQVSHDAGDYLCNFLYYLSLRRLQEREPRVPVLFVHMPMAHEIDGRAIYSIQTHLQVVTELMREVRSQLFPEDL